MLQRQVIYRDFFEFAPPGTESVYTTLFHWFGVRAWIPQAMLVLLGVGLTWLSVQISKSLLKGSAVFLPGFLFVTLVFRNALDGSHHWYAVLAVVGALAIVIKNRNPMRLTLAGALCGLAMWFSQTHGLAGVLGFGLGSPFLHGGLRFSTLPVPAIRCSIRCSHQMSYDTRGGVRRGAASGRGLRLPAGARTLPTPSGDLIR
jgi:hypothetical protein